MTLPAAFAALMVYRRWINWDAYPDPDRPGKTIKRPMDVRDGKWCNSNDPAHQYSYAEAAATGRQIGFVFNEADGFFFADIDDALVRKPDGSAEWSLLAQDVCRRFHGAAVEVSQSHTGLHIIGRGRVPDHSCKNIPLKLEFYTHERFVALTGINATGDAGTDHTPAATAYCVDFFPPSIHGDIAGWTDTPATEWSGPIDDAELIRIALMSGKNSAAGAFGTGHVTFADLWNADADKLAKRWPSSTGNGYDASQADGALASHLAFWTGKDCERIRRLMNESALRRPKWDERPAYLETTVIKATSVVTNVMQKRAPVQPPTPAQQEIVTIEAKPVLREAGREFLGVEDQISFFTGCVYVVRDNEVFTPHGELLDKARFDVVYAGHVYTLDGQNEKVTDSAFEAFTRSRIITAPKVDRTCFRPIHAPGSIILEEGRSFVNTYIPVNTKRTAGDPSKFLDHLAKMLPNDHDRSILLHYMASLKQNPGYKFQWWPVVQGAEGNGKSILDVVMRYAVGSRYSHLVNPQAMEKTGNQFNTWIEGNLYVGIEEIYISNRRDFLETFKTVVTNEASAVEGKGTNQTVGDNFLNGMLFTNHLDGVPISTDRRRYAIFYTAQQSRDDLERDGMLVPGYFPDIYNWLRGRRDYAELGADYGLRVVNDYLASFPLQAELDPAQLCDRAPATSSTEAALKNSRGQAEMEIIEAIEEGRPGFCGGWVSSVFLDRLLEQIRKPVPRQKRQEMMRSLGYVYHPALSDGRVNNLVMPDNAKPRLYIRIGHISANLADPASAAKAYTAAQNAGVNDHVAAAFGGTR